MTGLNLREEKFEITKEREKKKERKKKGSNVKSRNVSSKSFVYTTTFYAQHLIQVSEKFKSL